MSSKGARPFGGWVPMAVSISVVIAFGTSCTSDATEPPAPAPEVTATSSTLAPSPTLTPATTPVPPPSPGKVTSTVAPRRVERRAPTGLDGQGEPAKGIEVTLTSVKGVRAEARGPGEVSGPALAVTVQVANATDKPFDTANAVVTLTSSGGRPGLAMTGPPAQPLPSSVAAQSNAFGVYLFTVPVGRRDPITVEVAVSAAEPVVVFRGPAR